MILCTNALTHTRRPQRRSSILKHVDFRRRVSQLFKWLTTVVCSKDTSYPPFCAALRATVHSPSTSRHPADFAVLDRPSEQIFWKSSATRDDALGTKRYLPNYKHPTVASTAIFGVFMHDAAGESKEEHFTYGRQYKYVQ